MQSEIGSFLKIRQTIITILLADEDLIEVPVQPMIHEATGKVSNP